MSKKRHKKMMKKSNYMRFRISMILNSLILNLNYSQT